MLGVDLPAIRHEVLSQMRSGIEENAALISALSALDDAIARHYVTDLALLLNNQSLIVLG